MSNHVDVYALVEGLHRLLGGLVTGETSPLEMTRSHVRTEFKHIYALHVWIQVASELPIRSVGRMRERIYWVGAKEKKTFASFSVREKAKFLVKHLSSGEPSCGRGALGRRANCSPRRS